MAAVKLLILENDLMWGPKLALGAQGCGWEAVLLSQMPDEWPEADAAVVNLASAAIPALGAISACRERGLYIIAHASHSDKESMVRGQEAGVDRLATNGQITRSLPEILSEAEAALRTRAAG